MIFPADTAHRIEYRLVVLLVLLVVFLEFTLRHFEDTLSGNINHIFNIPHLVTQFDDRKADYGLIFMGNSLSNNALDIPYVEQAINSAHSGQTKVLKITPDATSISDWYCLYHNTLEPMKNPPDTLVIGFAWAQLADQHPVEARRLGGFFCGLNNIPDLSDTELHQHQKWLEFLAGKISHVYVNRERIRNRILSTVIPHYKEVTQSLNQTEEARDSSGPETKQWYSYHLLKKLDLQLKRHGTRLVLMAMPVINPYQVDQRLIETANNLDISILDLRNAPGISRDLYKDPIHLNEAGRKIFSKLLIDDIAPEIRTKTL